METTAQVREVTKKTINPKSGAPPFTLFEIEDSNGTKWTTKKQDIALTAHSLVGKNAQFEGTIRERGQYRDYFLNNIVQAPEGYTNGNGNGAIPDAIPQVTDTFTDTTNSRDESIWRQTACKVAAQLADNGMDFWRNVDILVEFFRTGVNPAKEEQYATATAQTQEFSGDDDIPF